MRETVLTANDLIYPVFVHELKGRAAVPSMPGIERLSIDELLRVAEQASELRVPALALFPVTAPEAKSLTAEAAWDDGGLGEQRQRGVVGDGVRRLVEQAAVPVRRVLAEADVGDDGERVVAPFDGGDGARHRPGRAPRPAALGVLRLGDTE
jgi:hypothetical protein